jgi:hypothetical protein
MQELMNQQQCTPITYIDNSLVSNPNMECSIAQILQSLQKEKGSSIQTKR